MKPFIFLTSILLICSQTQASNNDLINPIIGNQSFESEFGYAPAITFNDQVRIQTHLAYVENLLRNKNTDALSDQEKINRDAALDLLHQYWTAGIFPKNYDHPEKRVPCFIDKDETICAVGYLIEKTAGRDVAEKINANHKYETILEMHDAIVADWIAQSGLTLEECATIQPTYGGGDIYYFEQGSVVSKSYAITSGILTGGNISLSVINLLQINRNQNAVELPVIGIFTGLAQTTIGALEYAKDNTEYFNANEAVSLINITTGIASIIFSTYNLADNNSEKNSATSYGFFPTPIDKNKYGLSFGFGFRF